MAKTNTARDLLWPTNTKIIVRVAYLYVGQGSSAIVFCKDGDVYRVLVVDINLDSKRGGIDVPRLVKDLLNGQSLEAFVNTHPHDDHLCGTKELSDAVDIKSVWHSNHKGSKKYGNKQPELTDLIKKVKKKYGDAAEVVIETHSSPQDYGQAQYHFLHPTEHLTDEVNEEEADARRARIHEQCGVLKFGKDKVWIMFVGDANRCAFEEHINKNHPDSRLKSVVLEGSHHGSDTFFRENEEQEEYMKGLTSVDPQYVVVSAPTQEESPHDHPCDFAMEKYEDQCSEENVLHTGEDRYCFVFDIFDDGTTSGAQHDEGKLAEEYGLEDDDEDDGGGEKARASGPFVVTSPREQTGPYQPRKYG